MRQSFDEWVVITLQKMHKEGHTHESSLSEGYY